MDFSQVLQECRFYLSECENLINDYAESKNLSLERLELLGIEDKNKDLLLLYFEFSKLKEQVDVLEQSYSYGL